MIDIVKPDKIDVMLKITNERLVALWILLFCVGGYAVYIGELDVLAVATVLNFGVMHGFNYPKTESTE